MNPLIELKKTAPLPLITLILYCFALSPMAQAFLPPPPPDGGYPGLNTAEGHNALFNLTTGSANTAVGWFSLLSDTAGSFNTAAGAGTLLFNTGEANTAFGAAALLFNTAGSFNTALGTTALLNNTTGTYNIGLGANAGNGVTTASNVIVIGGNLPGGNVDHTIWVNNIWNTTTQSGVTATVLVSEQGQLGVAASSERFKKDIATMEKASEAILSLRPVTFHYKTDTKGTPQFGLVAEEVAKMNPALVLPDKEGKPYTVRYEAVNVMLLNEFLKEHRKNEEQQATIARLIATDTHQQKQIEALTAALQKVSAQLEASKPAPQVVKNDD